MKRTFKISIKPILVASFSLLLIQGCTSYKYKPALYEKSTTGLDFSKYSRNGFLVTTGDFYQSYQSLSILRATCYDGYIKKDSPETKQADIWKNEDVLYSDLPSDFKMKDYEFKSCKLSELLDYMVESATKMGANGIIRLEITPVSQNSPVNGQPQDGILMTGLAISFQQDK
jgi:hypothetical protein